MRIGFGYDSHRLVPGRALILGGVQVPSTLGPEAHSDGDALIHALIDALLGASSIGTSPAGFFWSEPSRFWGKQDFGPET